MNRTRSGKPLDDSAILHPLTLRTMLTRSTTPLPLLTRLTASATALVMLALTVFAASPVLHAWLHDHSSSHAQATPCPHGHAHDAPARPAPAPADADDALCVVTQFSQGHAESATAPALLAVATRRVTATVTPLSFAAPCAPEFVLPPGCGPPAV